MMRTWIVVALCVIAAMAEGPTARAAGPNHAVAEGEGGEA
jgi:hypothetical protein